MNYNSEHTIECELCGRIDRCTDGYDDPEMYFKSIGWDEADYWTLCPVCANGGIEE